MSAFIDSEYRGPERRRRVAYVTRNTEYHLESGLCVAVRDRATGQWQLCHDAVGRRLSASVRHRNGQPPCPSFEAPGVGDALFFAPASANGAEVLTSNLQAIERPQKATVSGYPV